MGSRLAHSRDLKRPVPAPEVALADDHAAFDPEHLSELRVELDPAGSGAQPDLAVKGEHGARVDELQGHVLDELPRLVEVGRPLTQAGVPAVHGGHPWEEPLAGRVVAVVGSEAHDHHVEVLAHPGAPAGQRVAANHRGPEARAEGQPQDQPRQRRPSARPEDHELLLRHAPLRHTSAGCDPGSRDFGHRRSIALRYSETNTPAWAQGAGFSATNASLRTRPSRSQALHSRWPATSSSSAWRPITAAMSAASAVNASISASATSRWDALQSSSQRTASPVCSRRSSISSRGVSQTVSASGICARSGAVRGRPSSMVKAKRPPVASAPDMPWSSGFLSRKASMVSSRSTTSNGPLGTGGTSMTSKRQGRSRALARAMSIALALRSTPR